MTGVHPSKVDLRDVDAESVHILDLCQRDVGKAARMMVKGKDKKRLARLMGVSAHTFGQKLVLGRFTASQFLMLSYLCGYEIKLRDKYQTMIDDFLED